MIRSLSSLVWLLRLLPRLRRLTFHDGRLRDGRTWREGVLSLKHRRCNETNEYHRAQQSPHENDWLPGNENPHDRTSGDEERLTIASIILRATRQLHRIIRLVFAHIPPRIPVPKRNGRQTIELNVEILEGHLGCMTSIQTTCTTSWVTVDVL